MINKKSALKKLIVLGVLLVLFGILLALKTNSVVCEFFATTFSRAWIFLFGNLFGVLPFSLYELLLVVAILGVIAYIVYVIIFLCRRKWNKLLSLTMALAIAVVAFLNIYTVSASFSYNRAPLPQEVYQTYSATDFSKADAIELAEKMVAKANKLYNSTNHDEKGNIIYPSSFRNISSMIADEYARLDSRYFSSYTPKAKKIINKTIMSEMHIVGVFFAPFGEANINGNETNLYLPHTMAHELAHGKGVMRENEANLVASYILLTSDNEYLAYGATVKGMFSALSLLSLYPDSQASYQEIYQKIEKGIFTEINNYHQFYGQFTLLDDIGEFFNDLYLKLQNQGGTGSYIQPPDTSNTGEVDGDNRPILQIINFGDTHNLLIKLFKENRL